MPTLKKGGLGRGLDSLFEENGGLDEQASSSLRIMDLEPNRAQPRQDFDDEALAQLSQSIAAHGVLQPILVRPTPDGAYQIVAGERRWRAARAAGLNEVPVVIRDLTDEEAAAAALIENLQREDLNPVEEAQGYRKLMDGFGMTQEDVSRKLGKSRSSIANALRLLKLPKSIEKLVRDGQLSEGQARALLGLENRAMMESLAEEIIEGELSVRGVERLVKRQNNAWDFANAQPAVRRAVFFDEVQLSLEESMGRRIKVTTQGQQESGRIVIDFFDREDLRRIAHLLASSDMAIDREKGEAWLHEVMEQMKEIHSDA